MRVRALFRAPGGQVVELGHGDMIGRLERSALFLADGRISEAHALVSLRGDALVLLALRGRFALDGRTLTQLRLEPGQLIDLAEGITLEVLEVVLPEEVLALEGDGLPTQVLTGSASIHVRPDLSLRPGWDADAAAWVWSQDDAWRLQVAPAGDPRPLVPGEVFFVGERRLQAVLVPLVRASTPHTRAEGGIAQPLELVARFHSVHILRGGEERLVLDGAAARIVSELVALGGPASWDVVAREIWRDGASETLLRGRWDAALSRLRARLRAAGIRADLIRSDRQGNVELVLGPGDQVIDQV